MEEIKPIISTKRAAEEMIELSVFLSDLEDILKGGVELAKRKKGVIEKGIIKGDKVVKAVFVDMESYYKVIHVGEISLTKKFKKIFREG